MSIPYKIDKCILFVYFNPILPIFICIVYGDFDPKLHKMCTYLVESSWWYMCAIVVDILYQNGLLLMSIVCCIEIFYVFFKFFLQTASIFI